MSATIAVDDLRVGMFIHLDLGWMAHPFPRSSFRIADSAQIEVLRSLGLGRVRWDPAASDAGEAPPSAAPAPRIANPVPAAGSAAEPAESASVRAIDAPSSDAVRSRRLDAQREALARCERGFADGCRALKRAMDASIADPLEAGRQVGELSRAMFEQVAGEAELSVRLLGEAAGDRAAAHAMNVAVLSLLCARQLDLTPAETIAMAGGALLHDLGKLDLPEVARHLSPGMPAAARALHRNHVAHGVTRGRRMGLEAASLLVIAQHHEAADGGGYPRGERLERIAAGARIVALADRYDELCNAPLAANSMTPHDALSTLYAQSRAGFDPATFGAFVRLLGIYPPGSVVRLTDDRHAIVTVVNPKRPLKPMVMVFDPATPAHRALHLDLERHPDLGIRESLPATRLPRDAADYLRPRQRLSYFFDAAPVEQPAAIAA